MLKKLDKKKNQKGFTLLELLIVITIISILAAIAIPQFSRYQARSYVVAVKSDSKNAYTALQSYVAENTSIVPPGASSTGPGLLETPYNASRVSKDVTIIIAASTTSDATVEGTHDKLNGSYIFNPDGSVSDTLTPK